MASLSSFLSLFTILLASSLMLVEADSNQTLINETCSKTLYKELCKQTLSSSVKAATADLKSLASIAIEKAEKKASNTASHIAKLLETEENYPPTVQQCLTDCAENYEDVVDQLNDSLGQLDQFPNASPDDEDDIITWLSAAMSDVTTCEEGCQMQGEKKNVLTERNTDFNGLCSNALSIVKQLLNQ